MRGDPTIRREDHTRGGVQYGQLSVFILGLATTAPPPLRSSNTGEPESESDPNLNSLGVMGGVGGRRGAW